MVQYLRLLGGTRAVQAMQSIRRRRMARAMQVGRIGGRTHIYARPVSPSPPGCSRLPPLPWCLLQVLRQHMFMAREVQRLSSALEAQRVVRAFLARRERRKRMRQLAATRIQCLARGFVCR